MPLRGRDGQAARRGGLSTAATSLIASVIVGLAFFLRVYRLGDKNVWWDEGWTLWLSRFDLLGIAMRTAPDEHPPLHYWLMHFWGMLAGSDAFVGRFFSVFFGVLTVTLLYRFGRQIGGNLLGLLAALLLALARFHVWWSQDIKNYTLSGFFALCSMWFVLGILEIPGPTMQPEKRSQPSRSLARLTPDSLALGGYIVSMVLALYTHYLAALVFLADNILVLFWLLREWRASRRPTGLVIRWSLAQIAVLAIFAPWFFIHLSLSWTWTTPPPFDLGTFMQLVATVMALGVSTNIDNYALLVLGFTAIAAIGVLLVARLKGNSPNSSAMKWGSLFALILVLMPPVLIYGLSLAPAVIFASKIEARYLLILLPAYMVLVALGILMLARFSRFVAITVLVIVCAVQLFTLGDYMQQRVLRDEYSSLANMINAFALPGDAIVLNTDQEWPTFLYYLHPSLDWIGVPNGSRVDDSAARRIAAQAQHYNAVWLVTNPDALVHDPGHLVEAELARDLPKKYEQTFGDKRLALYAQGVRNVKDVPPQNFAPQFPESIDFDSRLRLIGHDLPVRQSRTGDVVRVVTYWASTDLVDVRVGLQQPDGVTVAEQTIPISIGAHERAEADLVVPPNVAASDLHVVAGARLKELQVGHLQVEPLSVIAPVGSIPAMLDSRFGDMSAIQLIGEDPPRGTFRAGDTVPLSLFWKTDQPQATSYTVFVHLIGAQYNPAQDNFLWGQVDRIPVDGQLPTTAWPSGQVIADRYAIPIQANAPAGPYKIEVGLYDAGTGKRLPVFNADGQSVGDALVVATMEIK